MEHASNKVFTIKNRSRRERILFKLPVRENGKSFFCCINERCESGRCQTIVLTILMRAFVKILILLPQKILNDPDRPDPLRSNNVSNIPQSKQTGFNFKMGNHITRYNAMSHTIRIAAASYPTQ